MEKVKLMELFKMQKVLRDHIDYHGEDKEEKMLLALLVEIGECANEWRGFKYWSTDQEPRIKKLKEEYVDGLHFVLDYGLEIGVIPEKLDVRMYGEYQSITEMFLEIQEIVIGLRKQNNATFLLMHYEFLVAQYLLLGQMLGFSDDDIFNAYVEKNKVNHQRQDNGY